MLQVFVDHPDYLREFLQFVVREFGREDLKRKGLSDIKIHHRLLEAYLYKNQSLKMALESREGQTVSLENAALRKEQESVRSAINDFLVNKEHDAHIDKNYVLFLFQIYNYHDGVKDCCQKLDLKQELLNFYISHDEPQEVLYFLQNPDRRKQLDKISAADNAKRGKEGVDGDLWIQALTYFRELKETGKDALAEGETRSEKYIKEALEWIG